MCCSWMKKLKFNDVHVLFKNSNFCSRVFEMHSNSTRFPFFPTDMPLDPSFFLSLPSSKAFATYCSNLPSLPSAMSCISWITVHSFLDFLQVYRASVHHPCGCTSTDDIHHGVHSSGKSWITSNAFLPLLGHRWLAKLTREESVASQWGYSSPLMSYCR